MELELKKMYDRAILGTMENHPDYYMPDNITDAVSKYLYALGSKNTERIKACDNDVVLYFSNNYKLFNINLREPLYKYKQVFNYDIALGYLEVLFNACCTSIVNDTMPEKYRLNIYKYFFKYINVVYPNLFDMGLIESDLIDEGNKIKLIKNYLIGTNLDRFKDISLNKVKKQIYDDPRSVMELEIIIHDISEFYISSLNLEQAFDFSSINVKEVSNTAKGLLSSVNGFSLSNSYSGTLLNNKISLATDRGYVNYPEKPQQDAVLSIVKSDDCILNVVSDGAGGAINAEKASAEIINCFKDWFNSKTEVDLKASDYSKLTSEINELILQISDYIKNNYDDCYATIALALTVGDYTIISNVGDSTIYSYDDSNDKLIELTTLDSASYGLSYEQARENPDNNRITAAVGFGINNVHFSIIENNGQRIILSSDGVTDLVNERNYKDFFINKTDANTIVKKAVYAPDYVPGINHKSADNVSAIVVDLPTKKVMKRSI